MSIRSLCLALAVFAGWLHLGCAVTRTTTATPNASMTSASPEGPATAGTAPAEGAYTVEAVTDEEGNVYQIHQGRSGAPEEVGCSDGQREAFVDEGRYPRIAGCLAGWEGLSSMRAASTGVACGDDRGACGTPADACAPGWHLCGADGALADLRQVSGEECEQAGGGRFSAAMSHCLTQDGCEHDASPDARYACFESGWCSETVCCGSDCGELGSCTDGVWPGLTHIPVGTDQGCGAVESRRAGGVLCCR